MREGKIIAVTKPFFLTGSIPWLSERVGGFGVESGSQDGRSKKQRILYRMYKVILPKRQAAQHVTTKQAGRALSRNPHRYSIARMSVCPQGALMYRTAHYSAAKIGDGGVSQVPAHPASPTATAIEVPCRQLSASAWYWRPLMREKEEEPAGR
jgi:hypothetical protein